MGRRPESEGGEVRKGRLAVEAEHVARIRAAAVNEAEGGPVPAPAEGRP